jgi:protoporphyrinogen oxidase
MYTLVHENYQENLLICLFTKIWLAQYNTVSFQLQITVVKKIMTKKTKNLMRIVAKTKQRRNRWMKEPKGRNSFHSNITQRKEKKMMKHLKVTVNLLNPHGTKKWTRHDNV